MALTAPSDPRACTGKATATVPGLAKQMVGSEDIGRSARLATAAYVAGENRILSAGPRYSNVDVFEYVSKVARLYQQKRLKRLRTEPLAEIANKGGNSP